MPTITETIMTELAKLKLPLIGADGTQVKL